MDDRVVQSDAGGAGESVQLLEIGDAAVLNDERIDQLPNGMVIFQKDRKEIGKDQIVDRIKDHKRDDM